MGPKAIYRLCGERNPRLCIPRRPFFPQTKTRRFARSFAVPLRLSLVPFSLRLCAALKPRTNSPLIPLHTLLSSQPSQIIRQTSTTQCQREFPTFVDRIVLSFDHKVGEGFDEVVVVREGVEDGWGGWLGRHFRARVVECRRGEGKTRLGELEKVDDESWQKSFPVCVVQGAGPARFPFLFLCEGVWRRQKETSVDLICPCFLL